MTIGPEPLVRAVYEQRVLVTVTGPRMIVRLFGRFRAVHFVALAAPPP